MNLAASDGDPEGVYREDRREHEESKLYTFSPERIASGGHNH